MYWLRGVWELIKNGILFWQAVNWMSVLVFHCCISQVSSFLQGKMACNLHLLIDDAINQALWEKAFALNTSTDYFIHLIRFRTSKWSPCVWASSFSCVIIHNSVHAIKTNWILQLTRDWSYLVWYANYMVWIPFPVFDVIMYSSSLATSSFVRSNFSVTQFLLKIIILAVHREKLELACAMGVCNMNE